MCVYLFMTEKMYVQVYVLSVCVRETYRYTQPTTHTTTNKHTTQYHKQTHSSSSSSSSTQSRRGGLLGETDDRRMDDTENTQRCVFVAAWARRGYGDDWRARVCVCMDCVYVAWRGMKRTCGEEYVGGGGGDGGGGRACRIVCCDRVCVRRMNEE